MIFDGLEVILGDMADFVWGMPGMSLMLLVGVLATAATRGVQIRKLGASLRQVWHDICRPRGEGVSSFQAVCTALAATVGTGNVAGVAGAIALGGPGAVFWMWAAAFFGMATKYIEVVLALRFRQKGTDGQWQGGPMFYIRKGLGERWRFLAALFAFFAVLASFGMGNMAQVNTIAAAVTEAAQRYVPSLEKGRVALATGGIAAALVALVTLGGAKRIGRVMEYLVPAMAAVYILGGLAVIVVHRQQLPAVFSAIVQGAFAPSAVIGGGAGVGIRQAIRWGIARGVFSNEAGLGSAPMAHAAAQALPEEQGLFGIFEVFLDTVILCSLTAVSILVSGVSVPYGQPAGAELATEALETVCGSWAAGGMAVCLSLLALATLISWNHYGAQCAAYLWGERGRLVYRIAFVLFMLLGATTKLSLVWLVSDVCNGLMALPNLVTLLALILKDMRKNKGEKQFFG